MDCEKYVGDLGLLAALQAAFFYTNLTQGDALGCCTFSPSGYL